MSRKLAPTTAAAAVTALALAAAPAYAASVAVDVEVNGSTAASDHNLVATAAQADTYFWINGKEYVCTDSSLTATAHSGTSVSNIADITAASWTGCTFTGFLPLTMTVTTPNWHLGVTSTSGITSGVDHAIPVEITNISGFTVAISGPFGPCRFNISGSVNGVFDEDRDTSSAVAQQIAITSSNLTVSNVNSAFACLGLVTNGNAVVLEGAYDWYPIDINAPLVNIR